MADNEVQIDSLTIAVEESANNAAKNLTSLASGLKKLQKVLSGLNVSPSVAQLNSLNSALGGISGTNSDKITALASSLLDLKSVGKIGVSIPKSLSNQISALGTSLSGVTESSTKCLSALSAALKNLGAIQMPNISASLGHQLSKIVEAANQLQSIDLSKLSALADALRPLNDLGRAQLTSFINQLGKLPELSAQLDAVDMDRFASQVERLAEAMAPLATEMDRIAQGFSKFPVRIQKFIQNNEKMTSSVEKSTVKVEDWHTVLGKILRQLEKIEKKPSIFKKLFSLAALSKLQKVFENTVESANKYIEDLNLFNVSMGKFTEEGQKYAELVGDSYGIDPAEFMRMQAVVMDISKSFGVATDTAYTMSKALTQLTYDISSLYNLNVDDAASKVQSALAGEIEPIRRLGKDLSVANLKLLATELGINANVDSMNQAEKAMLRTISLLRQSTSAMGDMSRTLDQPANQFRVLKAQITLLGRAVGDLLLPIVQKTLPYLTAFIKVGQQVVMAFAKLAGFELPKFDYANSTVSGIEDIGSAADDASKSVQKLYQLSFDELNILGSQNSSGTGSGTSAADIAKLEEELNRLAKIENDAFSKSLGETTDAIAKQLEEWLTHGEGIEEWAADVWENFKGIKDAAAAVADSLGLWKIPAAIADLAKSLGLDIGSVDFNFGTSKQGKVTGGDTLKKLLGSGLGLALGIGALAIAATDVGGGLLAKGLEIALGVGAIDMLYDNVTSGENDTSTGNGLLKTVTNALSLGLLGASLSLLGGKGLKYSAEMALGISSVLLLFDGITGLVDTDPDNDLASTVKLGIGAALGGVRLMIAGGAAGLKYTLPMALGFTSLSMIFAGASATADGNTLLGIVSGTVGQALAAATGGVVAKLIGAAPVAGAGLALHFSIPLAISLTLEKIGFFDKAGEKIKGAFSGMGEAFKKSTENFKNGKYDPNNIFGVAENWLDTLGETISGAFDGLTKTKYPKLDSGNSFKVTGKKITDEITAGIESGATDVKAAASKVSDDAASKFADLADKGKSAGENVAKGFVAGVDYNTDYVAKHTGGMANKAMVQFTDSLGIHSPSTVFEGYGINVDIGFANGVTLGLPNVKDAFGNVWTSIRVDFSAFANSLLASARTFIRQLNQVLSSASFSSGGAAQSLIGKTPRMIPAFATGGFPEDGMFYANSHELVGRFNNGRTAVANNTQIIEGIENAVYRAMSAAGRSSGRSGGKIELILDKQVVGRAFGDAIDTERRRSGANTKITFTNGGRGNG